MKVERVNCRKVYTYLCGNLDERLHTSECRKFRRHLERCPNCSAYLDSLKKTVYLYGKYPVPRLSDKKRRKLHAVLAMPLDG